ncbi:MAG: flagellar motor switch protein FliN [Planctomycetota bacterium]|nr:flagellar motor switch protein FliN [Planctomycetota bacterium]
MSDASPNESEGLSQEDIDAALNAAQGDAEPSGTTGESSGAEPASDPSDDAPDKSTSPEKTESADSPESAPVMEGLSQADIDAALSAADGPAGAEASNASQPINQADVDAALTGQGESDPQPETSSPADLTNTDGSPKLDSTGKPFDEAAAAMEAAIAEERAAAAAATPSPPPPPVDSMPLELPDLSQVPESVPVPEGLKILSNVDLHVKVELGRAEMAIEDVLRLGSGSVVELNKLAGDPVDVLVNDRLVALGEVLILNDNFCVRINEIKSGLEAEEMEP